MLFGRWVMLSLYTIYKFTYSQNMLWRNCFLAGFTSYTLLSSCWAWLLMLLIHTFTHVCHLSKQSMMHKPISHFPQKYSVLPLLFFIALTRQQRCFPFESQCWECLTSRQLIWDTDGFGLPRDTPLAVTFCSWDSVIKLWTRTSLTFCVSFYHHMFYGAGRHWG